MADEPISVGKESFKLLPDGTVVVEDEKLKEFLVNAKSEGASFEVLDAWLEVGPAI